MDEIDEEYKYKSLAELKAELEQLRKINTIKEIENIKKGIDSNQSKIMNIRHQVNNYGTPQQITELRAEARESLKNDPKAVLDLNKEGVPVGYENTIKWLRAGNKKRLIANRP